MADATRHVLVTGGTGYIGSHTVVLLVEAGWQVTIVDNLSNSNIECLKRINTITKKPEAVRFEQVDLRDKAATAAVLKSAPFEAVIHFAAFKAVGESRQKPLMYYDNNLSGTINLLEAMSAAGCKRLVFSSSCTVYGEAPSPLAEDAPTGGGLTNAYAATKYMMEQILFDLARCDPTWNICILRYFNPVGAHPSGLMGEDPRGIPNCLMPYVTQVLVGRLAQLTVFGSDYPTRDGTCIRDYIHVLDLAKGHIDAINWMAREIATRKAAAPSADAPTGFVETFNFGTGTGTTVLELVAAMEKASGKKVNMVIGPRRDGDLPAAYANPAKALAMLGWKAERDINTMCADAWRWQSENPTGYSTA